MNMLLHWFSFFLNPYLLTSLDGVNVADDNPLHEKIINVSYQGSSRGSDRIVKYFSLPMPVLGAKLSYAVKFDQNFQWVKGGKLLGLGPNKPTTGGRAKAYDSWSIRVMFLENGYLGVYLYDQDRDSKFGHIISNRDKHLNLGEWYNISLEVCLNTKSQLGWFRLFVNDILEVSKYGVKYRAIYNSDSKVSRFMFSTFFGGNDESYAPKDLNGNFSVVNAQFNNIRVEPFFCII